MWRVCAWLSPGACNQFVISALAHAKKLGSEKNIPTPSGSRRPGSGRSPATPRPATRAVPRARHIYIYIYIYIERERERDRESER